MEVKWRSNTFIYYANDWNVCVYVLCIYMLRYVTTWAVRLFKTGVVKNRVYPTKMLRVVAEGVF
jgi:hypothetical protein